jgi:hypothetical protein
MNFFNTLILLSGIGSKIGNIEMDPKFRFDIKKFRQLNNLSFLNHLPEFDNNRNFIIVNGEKVGVGTILKRPLDILEVISSMKLEFHYAAVLGTAVDGREILIEMTKGENIKIITKQDFLAKRFKESEIEIESMPPKGLMRDQIIERAKDYEFDIYHLLDLNCKVFVEYIIWKIEAPKRTIELKKFQLHLCDIAITGLKLQLSEPSNEKYRDFLTKQITEAENDKKRLALAIGDTLIPVTTNI